MKEIIIKVVAIGLGIVLSFSGLIYLLAYTNQKEIKTTCNKSLGLSDAFWYNLKAGGCPTITIKESK